MSGRSLRWSLCAAVLMALIVVPFLLLEGRATGFSEELLQDSADRLPVAWAVVLLLAADLLAPVPSSFVATAAGLLLGLGPGIAAAWCGLQAGALAGYALGHLASRRVVGRIVGESELQRASSAYARWGVLFLIAARAVPVLAEGSVVVAGVARMSLPSFFGWIALSNLALASTYAGLGAYVGDANTFLFACAASIVIPGALLLCRVLRGRGRRCPAASRCGESG